MLVHVCLDVTMQSQGSGNTLPVSLVRKRVSSLNKEGKPADSQDVGDGSDYRSLSPCNQNKIRCLRDLSQVGMCLETAFRIGIFVTPSQMTGGLSELNFSLNEKSINVFSCLYTHGIRKSKHVMTIGQLDQVQTVVYLYVQ